MRSIIRNVVLTLSAAAVLALAGCASFPQDKLATVKDMPSVTQYQHKPSVYIDLRSYIGNPDVAGSPPTQVPVQQGLQSIVATAVDKSGMFSSYSFDPSKKADADYTIQFYFYDYGNMGAAMISGFITGFTFGIIPGGATDNYTLRTTLVAKDGTAQPVLSSNDAISTWMGIWFIPAMGNSPVKAQQQTLGNMVNDALKRLFDTGQLKYSVRELPLDRAAA